MRKISSVIDCARDYHLFALVLSGKTPLHFAVQSKVFCHPTIIDILIKHGAQVNQRTETDGNTALHFLFTPGDGYKKTVNYGKLIFMLQHRC